LYLQILFIPIFILLLILLEISIFLSLFVSVLFFIFDPVFYCVVFSILVCMYSWYFRNIYLFPVSFSVFGPFCTIVVNWKVFVLPFCIFLYLRLIYQAFFVIFLFPTLDLHSMSLKCQFIPAFICWYPLIFFRYYLPL